ncbi:glycosyltransferase [Actinomadura sp. HBU206391]|uniref:glycosyltransferase n=1 Tax=Actinomadura sp. HBU206391 TaxID=2731692 RepID=UPI001650484F|nr:glycosyltransferase [Actinomadura sp. HBU206391]MBC6460528.1 glycosyltransferase [Actinomadura sp. HBU206391]
MKIAMISLFANPLVADGSGHSVHVAELARELGREGHHVTVYIRRQDSEARDKVRLGPGVTVEQVTAGPTRRLGADEVLAHVAEFGRHLARRWEDTRPDVVHAFFWTSGLAALSGAKDLDIPVVQTYHTLGLEQPRPRAADHTGHVQRIRLEKAIGLTADAVIPTCDAEADQLLRMSVPRSRIEVVPTGVDVDQFTPQGPAYPRGERRRLLVLSDLNEREDVGTAIKALARIPGTELVIAGGPPREELETDEAVHRLTVIAKEAGVADRVTFLGQVEHKNVPRLLRSADVLLTLPWAKTFGMVPLEAMACGVPVVATDVGGNSDSIIENVTGVHVPARRPIEVARRVRTLLADPTQLNALGIAAADRARSRYSWPRVAGETAKVYQKVIERRTLRDAVAELPG